MEPTRTPVEPTADPMGPAARRTRARVAALTRHRPNDPETIELSRDFKADRLADYIQRVIDSAPALTLDQRERLANLLRGGRVG